MEDAAQSSGRAVAAFLCTDWQPKTVSGGSITLYSWQDSLESASSLLSLTLAFCAPTPLHLPPFEWQSRTPHGREHDVKCPSRLTSAKSLIGKHQKSALPLQIISRFRLSLKYPQKPCAPPSPPSFALAARETAPPGNSRSIPYLSPVPRNIYGEVECRE